MERVAPGNRKSRFLLLMTHSKELWHARRVCSLRSMCPHSMSNLKTQSFAHACSLLCIEGSCTRKLSRPLLVCCCCCEKDLLLQPKCQTAGQGSRLLNAHKSKDGGLPSRAALAGKPTPAHFLSRRSQLTLCSVIIVIIYMHYLKSCVPIADSVSRFWGISAWPFLHIAAPLPDN